MDDLKALYDYYLKSGSANGLIQATQMIGPSKPLTLEDIVKQMPAGSNFAQSPDLYGNQDAQVRQYPGKWNLAGFVAKQAPNTAFVETGRIGDSTIPHELAHTQAIKQYGYGDKYLGRVKDNEDPIKASMKLGTIRDAENDMADFAKNKKWDLGRGYNESLAELQGIEATLPAGTNIFDHPEFKELFKDKKRRRLYESRIFPNRDKVFDGSDTKINYQNGQSNDPDKVSLLNKLRRFMRGFTSY